MSRCMECNAKGDCEEWCGMTKLDLHDQSMDLMKDNHLLKMHVDVLNRQLTNLQIYMQGELSMGGRVLQRIMDGSHESFIEMATGEALDSMGKHVGEARNGMPDADYRQVVRYELKRRGRIK